MALHVDRDRIHGDVRGGGLDVHRESGGIAAEALRPDAEEVDRLGELAPRASRPPDPRSASPSGARRRPPWRDARKGRRCRPRRRRRSSAGRSCRRPRARNRRRSVLMASTPSAGTAMRSHELFSEPDPLGIISIARRSARRKSRCGSRGTPRPVEVCSFFRVIGCTTDERNGCSRVARSQPLRIASFSSTPSTSTPRPIAHVVDRNAGVLAQQVVGVLRDGDVADHGAEHALRAGVASRAARARRIPASHRAAGSFSARM